MMWFVFLLSVVDDMTPPPMVRDVINHWAIERELLDYREACWMFVKPPLLKDVGILWTRHRDLAKAPFVVDSTRFPNRKECCEFLAFNSAYRINVKSQQFFSMSNYWQYCDLITEIDRLHDIWDTCHDANADYFYVTCRRQSLEKLRDLIGPDRYYAGAMPPPVPLSAFWDINDGK